MQQADDADLTAAVTAATRRFVFDVLVDWNGTGLYDHPESDVSELVEGFSVERALTSDLPDTATLLDGYITAKATVTLRSRRRRADLTFAQALVPSREDSPLFQKATLGRLIRVNLGVRTDAGIRWVRQFTGRTSNYDLDPARGEAKLEALDPSAFDLNGPVTLPFWGQYAAQRSAFGGALDVNSQWPIDFAFRRMGIYASPPTPSGTIVSVTCHGGQVAEVGVTRPPTLANYITGGTIVNDERVGGSLSTLDQRIGGRWVDGPFGMLAFRGSGGQTNVPSGVLPAMRHRAESAWLADTSLGFGMSGWVYCGAGAPGVDGTNTRRLMWSFDHITENVRFTQGVSVTMFGDGGVGLRVTGPSSTWNSDVVLSTAPLKWRFIGVHWKVNADGTMVATTRVDGAAKTTAYPAPGWPAQRSQRAVLYLSSAGTYSCVTGWLRAAAPTGEWTGETWTPQADIGRGLLHYRYLPDIEGVKARDLVQDIAAAEYAVIGCTEFGRWYFRPRGTATETTPDLDLTSSRNLKDFGIGGALDSVSNTIVSTVHASYYSTKFESIYKAEDVNALVFGPGTRQFDVTIPGDTTPVDSVEYLPAAPGGEWVNKFGGGYRAVRLDTLADVSSSVRVLAYLWTARTVRVFVINNSGTTIALADTESTTEGNLTRTTISGAALAISGYKLTQYYDATITTTDSRSTGRYGVRPLELGDGPWQQSENDASEVGFRLVHDLAYPVPTLVDIPAVGDPRVQNADSLRIREPDGLGKPIIARVLTLNRTVSKTDGLADVYGLRPSPDTWPV